MKVSFKNWVKPFWSSFPILGQNSGRKFQLYQIIILAYQTVLHFFVYITQVIGLRNSEVETMWALIGSNPSIYVKKKVMTTWKNRDHSHVSIIAISLPLMFDHCAKRKTIRAVYMGLSNRARARPRNGNSCFRFNSTRLKKKKKKITTPTSTLLKGCITCSDLL